MSYEVNGKKYNMYSSTNQRILDKFVNREVYSNVTDMVEFILQNSYGDAYGEPPFTRDDIENAYVDKSYDIEELREKLYDLEDQKCILEENLDSYESELEDIKEQLEEEPQRTELRDDINELEKLIQGTETSIDVLEEDIDEIEHQISNLEEEDGEENEVLCWYLVSGWLCDKLKDKGEVVIEHENLWGRGTFGQSISLDWVIGDICKELEILEGQEFAWQLD